MSCRRSLALELPDFLARPGAPEFADFRDHYPRCRDCAAEVRAWTELSERLRAGGAGHPDPERWVRYHERRQALPADERRALERHLEGCAACRDELSSLARFSPARLAASAAPRPEARSGLRAAFARLPRLLLHPAFAWGLVGLLLVPLVYRSAGPFATREPATAGRLDRSLAADAAEETSHFARGEELAPPPAERPAPAPARAGAPAPPPPARPVAKSAAPRRLDTSEIAPPGGGFAPSAEADAINALQERAGAEARARRRALTAPAEADAPAEAAALEADTPPPAGEAAAPALVWLRPDERASYASASDAGEVTLALALPGDAAGTLEIRIADAAGARELRERVAPASGARGEPFALGAGASAVAGASRAARLRVPAAWLVPGHYRVEVRAADGARLAAYDLSVVQP